MLLSWNKKILRININASFRGSLAFSRNRTRRACEITTWYWSSSTSLRGGSSSSRMTEIGCTTPLITWSWSWMTRSGSSTIESVSTTTCSRRLVLLWTFWNTWGLLLWDWWEQCLVMATKVINAVIGGESIKWGIKVVILEAVHMWQRAVQKWPITMTEATSDLRGAHEAKRGDINSSESLIVYSIWYYGW